MWSLAHRKHTHVHAIGYAWRVWMWLGSHFLSNKRISLLLPTNNMYQNLCIYNSTTLINGQCRFSSYTQMHSGKALIHLLMEKHVLLSIFALKTCNLPTVSWFGVTSHMQIHNRCLSNKMLDELLFVYCAISLCVMKELKWQVVGTGMCE
jgi:hypothetical protein